MTQLAIFIFLSFAAMSIAAYYIVRLVMETKSKIVALQSSKSTQSVVLPLRLQAYERMALFLERIDPNQLVMRIHTTGLTVSQEQNLLLTAIRSEFEHNLSQQIYISDAVWEKICDANEPWHRGVVLSEHARAGSHHPHWSARSPAELLVQHDVRRDLRYVHQARSRRWLCMDRGDLLSLAACGALPRMVRCHLVPSGSRLLVGYAHAGSQWQGVAEALELHRPDLRQPADARLRCGCFGFRIQVRSEPLLIINF